MAMQSEAKSPRIVYLITLVALAVGLALGSAGPRALTGTMVQERATVGEPVPSADHTAVLHRIERSMQWLSENEPQVMQGFQGVWTAFETGELLDARTKQLMALVIAVAVGCDGCIVFHTHGAMQTGLTRAELAEAMAVALAMGGGPAIAHASIALEAFDQFEARAAAAGE